MTRKALTLLSLSCFAAVATGAYATTLHVTADFPTIQSAVDAATSGDTVLVEPGTYFEHLEIFSKDIVLHSSEGSEQTVIDATASPDTMVSAIWFSDVGEGGELKGFTVRGGTGTWFYSGDGGGVFVTESLGAGPLIADNVITENHARGLGGGGRIWSAVRLIDNVIAYNTARFGSGGLYLSGGEGDKIIVDNDIYHNENLALGAGTRAGGVELVGDQASTTFRGNVVAFNRSPNAAGMAVSGPSMGGVATVESNTIAANWGDGGVAGVGGVYIWLHVGGAVALLNNVIAYNLGGGLACEDIFQTGAVDLEAACNIVSQNSPDVIGDCGQILGVNGNINSDPMWGVFDVTEIVENNFCLGEGSPALPENAPPGCGLIGAVGACPPIAVEDAEPAAPRALGFAMARPNPFVSRTTIPLVVAEPGEVEIAVYDALGRKVRELHRGWLLAGEHLLAWDGRDEEGRPSPSGVYIAKVRQGDVVRRSRALLLVR